MEWDKIKHDTNHAFYTPLVGDCYTERLSNWMWVLKITDDYIYYLTADSGTASHYGTDEFPYCGKLWKSSPSNFRKRYEYGGGVEGYWVTYHGHDPGIDNWYGKLLDGGRKIHIYPVSEGRARTVIW